MTIKLLLALASFVPVYAAETNIFELVAAGDSTALKRYVKKDPNSVHTKQEYTLVTPMHEAACRNYIWSLEVLRAAGADINAGDGFGTTPLEMATALGRQRAVNWLKTHGAKPCNPTRLNFLRQGLGLEITRRRMLAILNNLVVQALQRPDAR